MHDPDWQAESRPPLLHAGRQYPPLLLPGIVAQT